VEVREQMNLLRRFYDWLLHWASTPYAAAVLFVWAFAESSCFPIPPDAFLIAMVLGARLRAFRFALLCSLASVLGGMAGYGIGYYLWWSGPGEFSQLARFFFAHVPGFSPEQFARVQGLYEEWNFWVVFTAGFLISLRFLFYYFTGSGLGHLQSLILSAVLMIVGFQVLLIGLVSDVLSANRKLLEDILYRVRSMELAQEQVRPKPDSTPVSPPLEPDGAARPLTGAGQRPDRWER